MAALSRPSLRSSSRHNNTTVDNLAITDLHHNATHPPTVRPAKRVRDASSSVDNDLKAFKKHKTNASVPINSNPTVRPCKEEERSAAAARPSPLARDHDPVAKSNHAQQSGSQESTSISARSRFYKKHHIHEADGAKAGNNTVDKRSLRSHDGGARLKSELSSYFANYDEILSTEAKQHGRFFFNCGAQCCSIISLTIIQEFPTAETLIQFTDDPLDPASPHQKSTQRKFSLLAVHPPLMVNGSSQTSQRPENPIPQEFSDAQRIDFSTIDRHTRHSSVDPLTDAVYFKAHRRAERQEKQLRNIEKERAQHEKVQLERLLAGLQGHDWLRVMGINGITESEKKVYEPKRDYFIKEVTLLIEKFRMWKEEEKRRKAAKEQNLLDKESRCGDTASTTSNNRASSIPSSLDASAARQLQKEVSSAIGRSRSSGRRKKLLLPSAPTSAPTSAPAGAPPPPPASTEPPAPEKPFTSFFPKPYLRDAAIGKHRRGRTVMAFGHPIPDFAQRDFTLPSDMLSRDAIAASARSRRRARRESRDG